MPRPYLSVVIPAFNEASRLPLTLIDIDRHLSAQDFVSEIIVALSPSSDNSAEILKRFQGILKNLRVVPLIENQGKGFALRQGMAAAKGAYRLTMDADNSTAVIEFAKMIPHLHPKEGEGVDVAIGSRYLPGSHIDPPLPPMRRFTASIGRGLIRAFIAPKVSDTDCGFKCFSAHAADLIFPQCVSNGWAIETEVVARARKLGFAVHEVPVFWSHDSSNRHGGSRRGIVAEHLRLWWKLLNQKGAIPRK